MKNKWIIFVLIFLLGVGCKNKLDKSEIMPEEDSVVWYLPEWEHKDLPEKRLELLRFHHSLECQVCKNIGDMILYMMEHDFAEEFETGKIIYKVYNSEFLENKPILDHYEVMEEDLLINLVLYEQEEFFSDQTSYELWDSKDQLYLHLREVITEELSKLDQTPSP